MKLKQLLEGIEAYAPKDATGLYKVNVGDNIEIGIEGQRAKYHTTVKKIVSNGRIQDREGNIFNRDGQIHKRISSWTRFGINKSGPNKKISARQVTKKEYQKRIMSNVVDVLRSKVQWEKLSPQQLQAVGKIINLGFPQLNDFT